MNQKHTALGNRRPTKEGKRATKRRPAETTIDDTAVLLNLTQFSETQTQAGTGTPLERLLSRDQYIA